MSTLETWGIGLSAMLIGLAVLGLVVCLLSVMIRAEKTRPADAPVPAAVAVEAYEYLYFRH